MEKEYILKSFLIYKGLLISKLQYFNNGVLTIFLKEPESDKLSLVKIVFNHVIAFHDTGFLNTPISYVDINELGFVYSYYAQSKGLIPSDFLQVVFINENKKERTELIIAFKEVSFINAED